MDSKLPPIHGPFRTQRRSPPGNPASSPEAYKGFLSAVLGGSQYTAVPRDLACAIGLPAAALLMLVVTVGRLRADPAGFLHCTPTFVCNALGLSPEEERTAVECLEIEYQLVERKDRGTQRHLRVNVRRLRELMTEARNDNER